MAPRFVEASSLLNGTGPKNSASSAEDEARIRVESSGPDGAAGRARYHLAPATDKPPDQETDHEAPAAVGTGWSLARACARLTASCA